MPKTLILPKPKKHTNIKYRFWSSTKYHLDLLQEEPWKTKKNQLPYQKIESRKAIIQQDQTINRKPNLISKQERHIT
jgi:hypothetical protein